jgi:hypothetical protein
MVYQPTRYAWTGGTTYRVGAQVVGERLERLAQNGPVTPHLVVEDATPEDSPLHPIFEWDDAVAAKSYRVDQARQLIRSVAVVYETPKSEETKVRAFVSVSPESGRGYVSTTQVMSNSELRQQVFDSIVNELKRLKDKMRGFKEFSEVVNAIEQLAA